MSRKPIQLASTNRQIYALCDDGSLWRINEHLLLNSDYDNVHWERLPNIPCRVSIYITLEVEEIGRPVPDFLHGWRVEVDAVGDDKRYLKCSKHTQTFNQEDYELLDKYAQRPRGWPRTL